MEAAERDLAAVRLSQIATEVGLDPSAERLKELMDLLQATVDGVRATAELGLDGQLPAVVPELGLEGER